MTSQREPSSITLADGLSGGQLLLSLLQSAQKAYLQCFGALDLPADVNLLKAQSSALLPRFEAARVQSEDASEIARALYLLAAGKLRYVDGQGERPLVEALTETREPLPLVRVDLPGTGELREPTVDFAGRLYAGSELAELSEQLERTRFATHAVGRTLRELSYQPQASLRGQRFVLFGAGAELSPVYTLLEAGADVLWLDRERPPIDRLLEPRLAGSLSYVDRGVDLLRDPASVRATLLSFADGQPVHIGQYAFATGDANSLRLALTTNELVRSLPSAQVASLHFLLSPTSVNRVYPEDAQRAEERLQQASKVRRALLRTGQLSAGSLEAGEQRLSRAFVSQQGAAYHVAEWVGRRLAAEAFCEFGPTLMGKSPRSKFFVCANMAPVSATRSLASPFLEAALIGAPSFDMLLSPASTARSLCSLLTVQDVLRKRGPKQADRAARLDAVFAQQFHGGVHAQPYALDGIIRVAALKGMATRPKLAFEMLR